MVAIALVILISGCAALNGRVYLSATVLVLRTEKKDDLIFLLLR